MINKLEWLKIQETGNDDCAVTLAAALPGGTLLKSVNYASDERGNGYLATSMCFVPTVSEKEGNRADFKAWLESERRRESERFNTVTNDQPAIDVADPDAM